MPRVYDAADAFRHAASRHDIIFRHVAAAPTCCLFFAVLILTRGMPRRYVIVGGEHMILLILLMILLRYTRYGALCHTCRYETRYFAPDVMREAQRAKI